MTRNVMIIFLLMGTAITSHSVRSADTENMHVNRSQCVLRAGSGVVDYGQMSRWQLQETGRTGELTPGVSRLPVTIACEYAKTFHLHIDGGSRIGDRVRYGRSGWLNVRISNLHVDGMAAQAKVLTPEGEIADGGNIALPDGSVLIPRKGGEDAEGKTVTFDLVLEPRVPERDSRVNAPDDSAANITLTLE